MQNYRQIDRRQKSDNIEEKKILKLEGVVTEIYPGQKFQVKFPNGHKAIGSLAGKLNINNITVDRGDTVVCEISVDNLDICRIVYRKRVRK